MKWIQNKTQTKIKGEKYFAVHPVIVVYGYSAQEQLRMFS